MFWFGMAVGCYWSFRLVPCREWFLLIVWVGLYCGLGGWVRA